jgi:basic membrane lipoprotein Med (substrate-binding protein (PBP1-ABC) superfamily)
MVLTGIVRSRWRWWGLGATVAVVAIAVLWAAWPAPQAPAPRARQYLDVTACLLTDEHGLSGPTASGVWAAMQDASAATRVRVQYRTPAKTETAEDVAPYLTSMALARCDLIVTTDRASATAAQRAAKQFPRTTFYVIGGDHRESNVIPIGGTGDQVPAQVRAAIVERVRG